MYSNGVSGAMAAMGTALHALGPIRWADLSPAAQLATLEEFETLQRRPSAIGHTLIAAVADRDPAQVGGPVPPVIATRSGSPHATRGGASAMPANSAHAPA